MTTNDARCTREIKYRICYIWSIALYVVQTRKLDQRYLKSLDMFCWRRMGKISWTGNVKNKVLRTVKAERSILHARKRRKANCNDHILLWNCLLNHIIEGKTEIK